MIAGDGRWSRRVALPDSPLAARLARRVVADVLDLAGLADDEAADVAVLLASEVVANAVRHAAPGEAGSRRLWLRVDITSALLRVEVGDPDPRPPVVAHAGPSAECGRGMALVAALAKEWGVARSPDGPGKVVWHTLALSRPAR